MKSLIVSLALVFLAVPAFGQAPPRYRVVPLPAGHYVSNINKHGDVLVDNIHGQYYVRKADGTQALVNAYFYTAQLGDSGIVAGQGLHDRPYQFDMNSGTLTQLAMPPWYVAGFPAPPNIHGVGVGTVSQTPFGGGDAIRWNSPTDWEFLRMPNGSTVGTANGINDSGAIFGRHGFGDYVFWAPGQQTGSYVKPFGKSVYVSDITNTRGLIAQDRTGPIRSYVINFDLTVQTTVLNPFGSDKSIILDSMNEQGWLAGTMQLAGAGSPVYAATIWSSNTGAVEVLPLIDAPPADFFLSNVRISDAMIMYGRDNRDPLNPKYYILEPVPEPGTLLALSAGLAVGLRLRRTRASR